MKLSRSATASKPGVLLIVPELERWLDAVPNPPKIITHWLSQAQREALDATTGLSELLLGQGVGMAPFYRRLDGPVAAGSIWVNVSFVHLQADLNAVWMSHCHEQPDASALKALTELCQSHQFNFEMHPSGRAYIRLEVLPDVKLTPLSQTVGVSLDQVMPRGDDSKPFIQLINDSQIVFHDLSKKGAKPGAHGIWLWGLGALPPLEQCSPRYAQIYAQSSDLKALSHALQRTTVETPNDLNARFKPGDLVEWHGCMDWDAQMNLKAVAKVLGAWSRALRWGRLAQAGIASVSDHWHRRPADLWRRN